MFLQSMYLAAENDDSEYAGDDEPLGVEAHPREIEGGRLAEVVSDQLLNHHDRPRETRPPKTTNDTRRQQTADESRHGTAQNKSSRIRGRVRCVRTGRGGHSLLVSREIGTDGFTALREEIIWDKE